jgi:hypothetical protein
MNMNPGLAVIISKKRAPTRKSLWSALLKNATFLLDLPPRT